MENDKIESPKIISLYCEICSAVNKKKTLTKHEFVLEKNNKLHYLCPDCGRFQEIKKE